MPSVVFEAFTSPAGAGTGTNQSVDHLSQQRTTINNLMTAKNAEITNLQAKITSINGLFRTISQPNSTTNSMYSQNVGNLISGLRDINSILNDYYINVVQPSQTLLRDATTTLNINDQTALIDVKLRENATAKRDLEEATEKLSTAHTREATIDTKEDAISYQQAWGYIARPLKKNSIPILIVFTLLFAGIGIVGLWYVSPYAAAAQQLVAGEVGFFQHPAVWMTLTISGILVLIFGSLKLTKQI